MKRFFFNNPEIIIPVSMFSGAFIGGVSGVYRINKYGSRPGYEPEDIGIPILFGALVGVTWPISVPLGLIYLGCSVFVKH